MKNRQYLGAILCLLWLGFCGALQAQETPQNGSWVVKDFKFHTGEVLPELRLG